MPQIDQFTTTLSLPGPVATYLRAVNAGATDEFRASFADDAVVVDANRALSNLDAITEWAGADIFGAHVHFDVLNVTERQERTIVTLTVDCTFIARDYPILS